MRRPLGPSGGDTTMMELLLLVGVAAIATGFATDTLGFAWRAARPLRRRTVRVRDQRASDVPHGMTRPA
ncbi:MAG: hypothetical protein AB7J28_09665 [Hyphomonadaceae bacterium]